MACFISRSTRAGAHFFFAFCQDMLTIFRPAGTRWRRNLAFVSQVQGVSLPITSRS